MVNWTDIDSCIGHVKRSFDAAEREQSKLPEEIFSSNSLAGMSTPKVRHFLNNINSLPNTNYLEIGCWQGSTLCAAAYENPGEVFAIDYFVKDFSRDNEGRVIKDLLFEHLDKFALRDRIHFFDEDCFEFNLAKIPVKIDVYFYDGEHSHQSQEKALTYYRPALADRFIFVVDDWRDRGDGIESGSMQGTFTGIKKGFNQLFHMEAPRRAYHQGLGIFVLEKR